MSATKYLRNAQYYATQFASTIQNAPSLAQMNHSFAELENAPNDDVAGNQQIIQTIKQAAISIIPQDPNHPNLAEIQRYADELQKNLAYFLKEKFNKEFVWAAYEKIQGQDQVVTPDALIRYFEEQGGASLLLDSTAKIMVDAQAMIDANGKPLRLIGQMQVEAIKDKQGNVTGYAIESSDAVNFIKNCIHLDSNEIVISGFSTKPFKKDKSQQFVEALFEEANKNLFPITVDISSGSGQNKEILSITRPEVLGQQSPKALTLIRINQALQTALNNDPDASKEVLSINTYALLLNQGSVEAAKVFIQQQMDNHPNDATYLHTLMTQAQQLLTGPNHLDAFHTDIFPNPNPKNAHFSATEEADKAAYAYHQDVLGDNFDVSNGELKKITDALMGSARSLIESPQKADLLNRINAQVAEQDQLRNQLQGMDPAVNPGAYDRQAIETQIEAIKGRLIALKGEVNALLQPIVPQPVNPVNPPVNPGNPPGPQVNPPNNNIAIEVNRDPNDAPYSPEVLIENGMLPRDYAEQIERLEHTLATLNKEKNITPQTIKQKKDSIEDSVILLDLNAPNPVVPENVKSIWNDTPNHQKTSTDPYSVEVLIRHNFLPANFAQQYTDTEQQLQTLRAQRDLTPNQAQAKLAHLETGGDDVFAIVSPDEINKLRNLINSNNQLRGGPRVGGA